MTRKGGVAAQAFVSASSHDCKFTIDDVVTTQDMGQLQERYSTTPSLRYNAEPDRFNDNCIHRTILRMISHIHIMATTFTRHFIYGNEVGRCGETHVPKLAALGRKCC